MSGIGRSAAGTGIAATAAKASRQANFFSTVGLPPPGLATLETGASFIELGSKSIPSGPRRRILPRFFRGTSMYRDLTLCLLLTVIGGSHLRAAEDEKPVESSEAATHVEVTATRYP